MNATEKEHTNSTMKINSHGLPRLDRSPHRRHKSDHAILFEQFISGNQYFARVAGAEAYWTKQQRQRLQDELTVGQAKRQQKQLTN
jgi:hypothetical protein